MERGERIERETDRTGNFGGWHDRHGSVSRLAVALRHSDRSGEDECVYRGVRRLGICGVPGDTGRAGGRSDHTGRNQLRGGRDGIWRVERVCPELRGDLCGFADRLSACQDVWKTADVSTV